MPTDSTDLVIITSDIVSSFVSHNPLRLNEISELIATVHASLSGLSMPKPVFSEPEPELRPAVPIKKSITDDYLICLEDGKKFKSLKRHLAVLGMTPSEYRAKWSLPADYPMVSPRYSGARSELAKTMGLGTALRKPVDPPAPVPVPEPAKKKGRPKAAALKQAA